MVCFRTCARRVRRGPEPSKGFAQIDRRLIAGFLALARTGELATVAGRLTISRDEPDNRFYECALATRADFIITGNRKDFPKDLPPTKIVNARQFLNLLDV